MTPPPGSQYLLAASLLLCSFAAPAAEPRLDLDGDPLPSGALLRLGSTRSRAEGRVAALALSPDGRLLAASDDEAYVHVWERATGKLVRRIDADARAAGLAFSPDGKRIAALNRVGHGSVWDVATGRRITRLALDRGGNVVPARLFFTPDGKQLVFTIDAEITGTRDESRWQCFVYFVDASTGETVSRIAGRIDAESFREAALSPDGRLVAVSVSNQSRPGRHVRIIDAASGRVQRDIIIAPRDETGVRLPYGDEPWADLLFAPDGKTLAASAPGEITLLDAVRGVRVGRLEHGQVSAHQLLAFSPDGEELISFRSFSVGELRVWDVPRRRQLRDLPLGCRVAASDGDTLATGLRAGVGLRNLYGREQAGTHANHPGAVAAVAFSPDGRTLATGDEDDHAALWDVATGKLRRELRGSAGRLAFSPNGLWLLAAPRGKNMGPDVWDLVSGDRALDGSGWGGYSGSLLDVAFTSGDQLFPSFVWVHEGKAKPGTPARTLLEHRDVVEARMVLERRDVVHSLVVSRIVDDGHQPFTAVLSPDGALMACDACPPAGGGIHSRIGEDAATVRLVSTATGRELWRAPYGPPGCIDRAAFAPDRQWLLVGSSNGWLGLFELATGRLFWRVGLYRRSVDAVAYSPGGRLLATADSTRRGWDDYWAKHCGPRWLWDAWRGRYTLADRTEATSVIRLWELPSGQEVGRIENAGSKVCSLAFSPDGARLASGLNNGTALVWDVKQVTRAAPTRPKRLSDESRERLWDDLAGSDGWLAWRALGELYAAADTVPFLSRRLAPAAPPDTTRIGRLVAALDGDDFGGRESAQRQLRALPEQAGPLLRRTLQMTTSAEVRRRLRDVLADWPPHASPEVLRKLRAIVILGWIDTAEARTLLKALGEGSPDAPETRAAPAAFDRLTKRGPQEIAAP
jgi:WD40 repeat protein